MKRISPIWRAATFAILIGFSGVSHEVPVHKNITRRAVQYLQEKRPELACAVRMEPLLQIGTEDEDSDTGYVFPLGRYYFHFSSPSPLNDTVLLQRQEATCDSVLWAFGSQDCQAFSATTPAWATRRNEHGWQAASSNAASDRGWQELGYLIHLLEDLTSPAHVRNDAHPHLPHTRIPDADPVEYYNGRRTHTPISASDDGKGADPSIPQADLIVDPGLTTPEAFLQRVRQEVQANFYSKDTVFKLGLPGPAAAPPPAGATDGKQYFYDAGGRRIAYKSRRYRMSGSNDTKRDPTLATINEDLAKEQFAELGPLAVRYVGSFIWFYTRSIATVPPGCSSSIRTGAILTSAMLDGASWSGVISYNIVGAFRSINGSAVPAATTDVPTGSYTLTYNGGGPPNSTFLGINPCPISAPAINSCTASLTKDQPLIFRLQFASPNQLPTAGFSMTSGTQSAFDGQTLRVSVQPGVTASVTFDASTRSFDQDGTISAWEWVINGSPVLFGPRGSEATFTQVLTVGTHVVQLTVVDNRGSRSLGGTGTVVVAIGGSVDWSRIFPLLSPRERQNAAMAYDYSRQEVVLYGGRGFTATSDLVLRDTWSWNGVSWMEKQPITVPALTSTSMVSNPGGGVLLFGATGIGFPTFATWDGTNWTNRILPPGLQGVRYQYALAFDERRNEVILFGGLACVNPPPSCYFSVEKNDTWVWDGIAWSQRAPSTSPPARIGAVMAYDAARQQLVLFGGMTGQSPLNDTWVWDGNTWTLRTPQNRPPARIPSFGRNLLSDSIRSQLLLQDSDLYAFEYWTWDGSDWSRQNPNAFVPGAHSGFAYDVARGHIVAFALTPNGPELIQPNAGATWIWGAQ